eukprot:8255701-Pyramimonas_sp.AAC.1
MANLEGKPQDRKASVLPSLAHLPLGYGLPPMAATPGSLRDPVSHGAPQRFRPQCANMTLPAHELADGRL